MNRIISLILFIFVMVFNVENAVASIVMGNTRVIYNAVAKDVSVAITNRSSAPVLVQSWMDEGDAEASPALSKVPFVILPPITRVDAQGRQALRISVIDASRLPSDRESLFWLNVLDVPMKLPTLESKNRLQVALQSRVKFFYRPEGLRGTSQKAPEGLIWRSTANGVTATNPSAWYVSLLSVTANNSVWPLDMVAPGESREFKADIKAGTSLKVAWIDDNGTIQVVDAITR